MNRPAKVQSVLDGVRDLLPTFRERADEGERLRVVPESSVKELEETGFFRLLQPKRYGGFEADPVDFYTAVRDIASADGSTDFGADGRVPLRCRPARLLGLGGCRPSGPLQGAREHLQKAGVEFEEGRRSACTSCSRSTSSTMSAGLSSLRVDDSKWVARESTAVSYWGHDFGGGS